ncbi:MAG: carbohydrate ABC transporter permease [Caldilineaceae bacterium]|nr:carbohydrate ABC transporter permease [Caldilineaceae bacterium]
MAAQTSTETTVRIPSGKNKPDLRRMTRRTILYVVAVGLSLAFGFPFFYAVASSLKAPSEIYIFPPQLLPEVPQWSNYLAVFARQPLYTRWFANTVVVTALGTLGVVLSASLVAYSFARFKFRGRNFLFIATLSTMMMPAQVTLIPQFILFTKIGWLDTLYPLWVPLWFGGGAFYIFLMRQFIMSLPRDLDEVGAD